MVKSKVCPATSRARLTEQTRPSRFRFHHLFAILALSSLSLFLYTHRAPPTPPATPLSFCPPSTSRKHIPTVVLHTDGSSARTENRTYWVQHDRASSPFLPFSYPPRDLRFAQRAAAGEGQGPNGQGNLRAVAAEVVEEPTRLCPVYAVAGSRPPVVPTDWNNHKLMFGMSTSPDRVLSSLPVWSHWLPSSSSPLDPNSANADLPLVLILTPPPNPTEALRMREAVEEAQSLGMHVQMRAAEASRFETRYFTLVREMWVEALKRETTHGIITEWFIFADDDTFFPDFDSVIRMLSAYDSTQTVLLGALSEATRQVIEWGHIAYGGAGIFVSRELMSRMNSGNVWKDCLDRFGSSFGGDAMISQCAALVLEANVPQVLVLDPTLHQLDIRGDSTGWFQSGFLITSLHHWGSWFTLFPPWISSGEGDQRKGISLVGRASKNVGGDNWGRRYVFDDGKVVVHLGYSVVIHLKPATGADLALSEQTWFDYATFYPMRARLEESVEKRTYYLTDVHPIEKGVVRLEHSNRENERVDVIFDSRLVIAKPKWKTARD